MNNSPRLIIKQKEQDLNPEKALFIQQ